MNPACIEPTFEDVDLNRNEDPGSGGENQCGLADVVDRCVGHMTEVFNTIKDGGGLDYRALNRVVQDCVDDLSEEDEDTRVNCISEMCSRLNRSAASIDLTPPLVCAQEFVNVIANDINRDMSMSRIGAGRTRAGRLVNEFMQMCMNEPRDKQPTANDDIDVVVSGCVGTYVRYCFRRESNQLEECIDEVEFLCDTIDDPNGQRQCLEAAEQAVSEELIDRCSQNDNLETCVSNI